MVASRFTCLQAQFAAYFNMGRQNAYISLIHISRSAGLTESENKESRLFEMKAVTRLSRGKEKPETREYLLRQLHRHFPMLKIMMACEQADARSKVATPDMAYRAFVHLFRVLNYERDRASHHLFTDTRTDDEKYIESERRVAKYLNHCFTVAMRIVRTRFGLDSAAMSFLTRERYKMVSTGVKDKRGRWRKKAEINPGFAYAVVDENGRLSDVGRIFLACQFVEKRYVSMLLDAMYAADSKTSGLYRREREEQRKIVREIFGVCRVRLPKERLDNEREDIALALDMLNELKKCPAELFDRLSPADQQCFRVISAEGDEEFLLKRSTDRFASLALRYIDERALFDKIRFQVNFGKYCYCLKADKHCVDGQTRVRVLQKELNGFGRIGEVERRRIGQDEQRYWNGSALIRRFEDVVRNEVADLPYVTDCRTHYLFNGDRIGLAFTTGRHPYLDRSGNYMPAIDADHRVICIPPVCWLSLYELPAMLFHTLLCDDERGATEEIVRSCVARYRKFFGDVRDGKVGNIVCVDPEHPQPEEYGALEKRYGIAWRDIPDKIRDYLVGRTRSSFDRYAADTVDRMIEKTKNRIRRFQEEWAVVGKKENKIGKRSYVDIRPGRLAGFLAQDIVFFQPSKLEGDRFGQDKPTGLNYRVIQASIALYDARNGDQSWAEFVRMFKTAGLVDSPNEHPFLKAVLERRPLDTVEFYRFYLEARLEALEEIRKRCDYRKAYFLHANRAKWAVRDEAYYRSLAGRYLRQPVELPRGLFEADIRERLLKRCGSDERGESCRNELEKARCNVTYMIARYLHHFEQDESQPFYRFARSYRIKEELDGEKRFEPVEAYCERDFKKELELRADRWKVAEVDKRSRRPTGRMREATPEEREAERQRLRKYYREYDTCERALRRYKVQDMLLFLMAKKIILAHDVSVDGFELGGIRPDGETSMLELKVPFSMTIALKDGRRKTIRQESIKIKNYGDFFRFLYDDRIKSLLPQIESVTLDRAVLEEELMRYDRVRPQIFDLILKFEKSIVDRHPELTNDRHGFTDLLQWAYEMNEEDRKSVRIVRNAFSHNFYPNDRNLHRSELPHVATEIESAFRQRIAPSDNP